MSLTRNREVPSPVTKYIEWKGGDGMFAYWDKENEQNVEVKVPFMLIVLDQLNTVSGYSENDNSGFWANEVRDNSGVLNVRTKRGTQFLGPWAEIKAECKAAGAKYCKSVYAMLLDADGNHELVNFKISGSGLGPWIDAKIPTDGTIVKAGVNPEVQKKGRTEFYEPVFRKLKKAKDATMETAEGMDYQLQEYLDQKLKSDAENPVVKDTLSSAMAASEERNQAAANQNSIAAQTEKAEISSDPLASSDLGDDIDDLPF